MANSLLRKSTSENNTAFNNNVKEEFKCVEKAYAKILTAFLLYKNLYYFNNVKIWIAKSEKKDIKIWDWKFMGFPFS